MRLPWRRAVPKGTPARPRAWIGGLAGAPLPKPFETMAADAFLANPVAHRAIRLLTESAGGAPVVANIDGEVALPLVTPGLLEAATAGLVLHGNAFIEIARDERGWPALLHPLRPERVTVALGDDGWPVGYRYKVGPGTVDYPMIASDAGPALIHIRGLNPLDDHYGAGSLSAASGAVALHNAAAKWNATLLDNAARPSGALVYEPGDGSTMSSEQFERLREELERGFSGAVNAGRPLLLEGGLKWQSLSLTPAELDFQRSRDSAAREIALAFGVPPLLLGLPGDSTHANYREANVALWRLTLLPMMAKICHALACGLATWWPGVTFSVDLDAVPALWADREKLWRHLATATFLSDAEKRELLGFGPAPPPVAAPLKAVAVQEPAL